MKLYDYLKPQADEKQDSGVDLLKFYNAETISTPAVQLDSNAAFCKATNFYLKSPFVSMLVEWQKEMYPVKKVSAAGDFIIATILDFTGVERKIFKIDTTDFQVNFRRR